MLIFLKTQTLDIKIVLDKINKLIEEHQSDKPRFTEEGFLQELNKLIKEYHGLSNGYINDVALTYKIDK